MSTQPEQPPAAQPESPAPLFVLDGLPPEQVAALAVQLRKSTPEDDLPERNARWSLQSRFDGDLEQAIRRAPDWGRVVIERLMSQSDAVAIKAATEHIGYVLAATYWRDDAEEGGQRRSILDDGIADLWVSVITDPRVPRGWPSVDYDGMCGLTHELPPHVTGDLMASLARAVADLRDRVDPSREPGGPDPLYLKPPRP